ncbi:endonuclease/exonuclease/phosphatase family protein [uncultured Thiodictyon sp.]|uniref:endonuclease/exonuclease/phosphatase family protein n=1 Tax=uncultured Thiodictyon sp. TaxID=1846217 RepID=UPI0025FE32CB|nr:endonuclease/exonuclease/phosphatase family protein [uncultured Thiodictyon sp.]
MLRVLFWNINGKPLAEPLRQLCDEHEVDLLVLSECNMPAEILLPTLNRDSHRTFCGVFSLCERISLFSRLPPEAIMPVSDDRRYCSIHAVAPPFGKEILLVAAHYPSKLHMSDSDQSHLMPRIAMQLQEAEARRGHTRTVLVGDLNMNPFETGVCGSEGLHAVMCKQIAKKKTRKVYGEERRYFYNPMWNFLGDETRGPPGTYYYDSGRPTNYYWNIFDQVLYRPALLEDYRDHDVSIITAVNGASLLRNGRLAKEFSDHLPITFTVRT